MIADHDNVKLNGVTAKALTAARAIASAGGGDVHILVTGNGCRSVAEAARDCPTSLGCVRMEAR